MLSAPLTTAAAETTREMMKLSPSAADKTAKRDLLSILKPVDKISSGMLVRLRRIAMQTEPYGTALKGLCRMDELSLRYAPTAAEPKGRDQPIQPVGVEAQALFHALQGPITVLAPSSAEDAVWSEDCDRLRSSADIKWFTAKDAMEAAKAVNVLIAATYAVRSGQITPQPCSTFPTNKRTCAQTIVDEGQISKLDDVETCSASAGQVCYELDVGSFIRLTIIASIGEGVMAPAKIISVSAEQYVIVT